MRIAVCVLFLIIFLQALFSETNCQEIVNVLVQSSNSPINTSSDVSGSLQCTTNSDESYAVCASLSNTAIKYNLQPCSFAAKGPNQGNYMRSCDLYESSSQSTSRAVCVKSGNPSARVYFHRVSDMINVTNVSVGVTGQFLHVIVDTPNQIAYISNNYYTPAIFKITNIGSSSPIVAGTLSSFGAGDHDPAAMLIIDGLLYVHCDTNSVSRLARINISTFTWNQTVVFASGENNGWYDNLANDDNYIYDLTQNGILVRCTYKNNNFARFDSLNTGLSKTDSLAISQDSSFLLLTVQYSGLIVVNTSTFSVENRALLSNPTSTGYVVAWGRPIILSKNNKTNAYSVYAFSESNDYLCTFNFSRVPFREVYPTIYPLPSSPINTSSGVTGSLQCTKNSDESYAVCASDSDIAIKYNLQPFSFAAKGPNQGDSMNSCDLYESSSQSTSRAVCVTNGDPNSFVYFYRVSDMINITNVTIGKTGDWPHVIVDTLNQVAFISNYNNPPAIYKITNIGSSTPIVVGNLTTFGSGDEYPVAMLIIDGFLYVHFYATPARLARINLSTFTWNQTVIFENDESGGYFDNLANDDNFIYDLTEYGILVRCTYKNNFSRFDSLNTGLVDTYSLAISSDKRTSFVTSYTNSLLQLVDVASFTMFGNTIFVPRASGRPIVTSSRNVYTFSEQSEVVYALRYLGNRNETFDDNRSGSSPQTTSSSSHSLMHSSLSLIETAAQLGAITDTRSLSSRETAAPPATTTGFESGTLTQGIRRTTLMQSTPSLSRIEAVSQPATITETETKPMTPGHRRENSSSVTGSTQRMSQSSISESASKHFDRKSSPLSSLTSTSSAAALALAAFVSASSTAALAIRTRTILSGVEEIMNNDCGSPFTEEIFETPPLISASPTQMYISGERTGGYATGLIVGDFILILVLVGTWFLFCTLIEKYVTPFLQSRKRANTRKRNHIKNIFTLRFLAESKIMIPAFNFGLMFLDPMFNSSIALIFIKEVGFGWKILGVVISILVLLVGFFFFSVIYKILISRNQIEKWHKFRPSELKTSKIPVLKLWYFFMDAEGEWMCPKEGKRILKNNNENNRKNNKKQEIIKVTARDVISWRFAEPVIDGFTNRFPRFAVVDILVMLSLAIALVIGHATANCTAMGILLIFPVAIHLLLVIFYRPDQEFLLRILIPVTDLLQVILVGLALGGVDEGVVTALAGILVAIQMFLSCVSLISIVLSIVDVMKEFQICQGNKIRQKEDRQSSNLRQLMPSKNNNSRQDDGNPRKSSRRK